VTPDGGSGPEDAGACLPYLAQCHKNTECCGGQCSFVLGDGVTYGVCGQDWGQPCNGQLQCADEASCSSNQTCCRSSGQNCLGYSNPKICCSGQCRHFNDDAGAACQ
jgi:hypothetical protein